MGILLECRHLTKNYKHGKGIHDLTLTLESGKITGLIGPNGSGKTTLIKLINGLLTPTEGEILINGFPPGVESKSIISYLPDRTYLPGWQTGEQVICLFRDMFEDFQEDKARTMASSLQLDLDVPLRTLSKGTQEKFQLILVMSRKARLYILDEPLVGVDPAARDFILETILGNYDPSASILLSTHLIQDVENMLDDIIILQNGSLHTAASADDLRIRYNTSLDQLFRETFKC